MAVACIFFAVAATAARAQQAPPTVVKMVPENGADDVDYRLKEIVITFSEPMVNRSWSVCGGGEHFPKIKNIKYKKDCTVLVIKVELKPAWTYHLSLNAPSFRNFISRKGVPLEPVPVTFTTRGKRGAKSKKEPLPSLGKARFELEDARGLVLKSQDYAGVPLFLAFGAAW